MLKRVLLLSLLFVCTLSAARDKQENWLQLNSPHFTVFCAGNEKQARRTADQFERMRAVFRTAFPAMKVDPPAPIIVIALKDNKDFRALEPPAYLAKGQLELAGLFMRTAEKNYVLVRLDAGGEHPYATVYHEYTHLLSSKMQPWLPLWLDEGLAEFYENTDISEKDTILGQASSDDILWLRQNRLLPLTTLLTVDHNSPFYHEEQKGSIFYSESWALTHYLEVTDAQKNTHHISDYVALVEHQVDPVTAAARAFGDLKQLQSALANYIGQSTFNAFKLNKNVEVDSATYTVQPITPAQADAVRADVLAYDGREKDAHTLLDQVLHDDPNNTQAYETMGYLEFRAGRLEQAEDWFQKAVKLDSKSYLANYYFSSIAMNRGQSGADIDGQIESSLRKSIQLNPSFAPSYERLAVFYSNHHTNLDQANTLILQAVQLDPNEITFRLNAAILLANSQHEQDAIAVLQDAQKLAKTPEQTAAVQNAMQFAQQAQAMRKAQGEESLRFHEEMEGTAQQNETVSAEPAPSPEVEEALKGPHRYVTGTIKNVRCTAPAAMDLDVDAGGHTVSLHAHNYYKLRFTALGFMPKSDLQPCNDLEGAHAKVEYIEGAAPKTNGLVAIEMHK